MAEQYVFVPCRLDRRDGRSALIEDADGWPRKVVGPLGRVDGRHLAGFADGQHVWVTHGRRTPEDFVPLGWPPLGGDPGPGVTAGPSTGNDPPATGRFGEVVRALAAECGTVYRLAGRAGVTQAGLWAVIRGRRPNPSAGFLAKLLAAAGKSWARLDECLGPPGVSPSPAR